MVKMPICPSAGDFPFSSLPLAFDYRCRIAAIPIHMSQSFEVKGVNFCNPLTLAFAE
jgi:hypothetical protein